MKIIAEQNQQGRFHFVVVGRNVGALVGHRGYSRSIGTWATRRLAVAAGKREFKVMAQH